MAANPTIVLIPGTWHTPVLYAELITLLKQAGYDTVTEENPRCDSSALNEQTLAADAASIRNNLLLPQLNVDKDVVLVMHSCGGEPAADAAKGLGTQSSRHHRLW